MYDSYTYLTKRNTKKCIHNWFDLSENKLQNIYLTQEAITNKAIFKSKAKLKIPQNNKLQKQQNWQRFLEHVLASMKSIIRSASGWWSTYYCFLINPI